MSSVTSAVSGKEGVLGSNSCSGDLYVVYSSPIWTAVTQSPGIREQPGTVLFGCTQSSKARMERNKAA